jgi:hypothetical protein
MTWLAFLWLLSHVAVPTIPDGPTILAEDQHGQVYLLADTQPRTVLAWTGRKLAKASAANRGGVTLVRAGRESFTLDSSVFPGRTTRDQHANGWRLVSALHEPKASRIEVRPAGTDTWQTPLDSEAVPADEYQTIVADEIGYVWFSTRTHVLCLDPRQTTNTWAWTAPQPVTALGLSPGGRALAGLANGELYELGRGLKGSGISQPYTVRQLPAKPIRAIHTDGNGWLWIASGKAVYRAAPPADAWQRHWQPLARMPVGNHDIFSAQWDGKLYVFGGTASYGYPARFTYFNELFVFDVRRNCWEIASRLDPPRAYNGCAALAGRVWVIGGRLFDKQPIPIDRVDLYDPKTGHWEAGPALPSPRSESIVLPVNDRIYVIGGVNGRAGSQVHDTLSIGPAEKAWRPEPPPPGGQLSQSSGGVIGDRIYVVAPQAKSVLCYDTVHRTWDKVPGPFGDITLWAAVCGAHAGEFWVMGGWVEGGSTDRRQTYIYSPQSNAWRSGPDLPTPLSWTSAQEVDGRLIITPGGTTMKRLDHFVFTDVPYALRPITEPQGKP